jgi:hypothetical protein
VQIGTCEEGSSTGGYCARGIVAAMMARSGESVNAEFLVTLAHGGALWRLGIVSICQCLCRMRDRSSCHGSIVLGTTVALRGDRASTGVIEARGD